MDSQCKYALIARGDAEMYIRIPTDQAYEEKIWDHASGSLIVAEAGGIVSDLANFQLDFSAGRTLKNNSGIICSNGLLHSKVIEAVKSIES